MTFVYGTNQVAPDTVTQRLGQRPRERGVEVALALVSAVGTAVAHIRQEIETSRQGVGWSGDRPATTMSG